MRHLTVAMATGNIGVIANFLQCYNISFTVAKELHKQTQAYNLVVYHHVTFLILSILSS